MPGEYLTARLEHLIERESRLTARERALLEQYRSLSRRAASLERRAAPPEIASTLSVSALNAREHRLAHRRESLDVWADRLAIWSARLDGGAPALGDDGRSLEMLRTRLARDIASALGGADPAAVTTAVGQVLAGLAGDHSVEELRAAVTGGAENREEPAGPLHCAVAEEAELFTDWDADETPAPVPAETPSSPPARADDADDADDDVWKVDDDLDDLDLDLDGAGPDAPDDFGFAAPEKQRSGADGFDGVNDSLSLGSMARPATALDEPSIEDEISSGDDGATASFRSDEEADVGRDVFAMGLDDGVLDASDPLSGVEIDTDFAADPAEDRVQSGVFDARGETAARAGAADFPATVAATEVVAADGRARLRRAREPSASSTRANDEEDAESDPSDAWQRLDRTGRPLGRRGAPAADVEHPLRPHRAELRIAVDLSSHNRLYTGYAGNISAGGLFVATEEALAVGSRVDLTFTLPDDTASDGNSRAIHVTAEVRWLRGADAVDAADGHNLAGMGLKFLSLTADDQVVIERFLADHPPLLHE